MKATIHFSEKEVLILGTNGRGCSTMYDVEQKTFQSDVSDYNTNEFLFEVLADVTDQRPELEKLLLMAVIEKEAEEKYPGEEAGELKAIRVSTYIHRKVYCEIWQSLINKIPSEEEIENEAKSGLDLSNSHDGERYYGRIEGRKDQIKELLLSLPTTANCEVEISEDKVTVQKIWI